MKRTNSQNIWLKRQNKDIFVKLSKAKGYRSRAAYKLIEINKRFKIINQKSKVVDLGASPGGWTQVVAELQNKKNQIIAIDKKQMEPVESCKFIYNDISNLLKFDKTLEIHVWSEFQLIWSIFGHFLPFYGHFKTHFGPFFLIYKVWENRDFLPNLY